MSVTRVLLASGSPRRRRLLEEAGLEFEIEPSAVEESYPVGLAPAAVARLLAERKARAVGQARAASGSPGELLVIGSDTIVAVTVDGRCRILGKPADEREARGMLETLSGSRHEVVTGVCVLPASAPERLRVDSESTWVTMRPITPDEITAYVASCEWRGKAGGYAIQETADRFVTRLEGGGFDNVVGLPVALTLSLLEELGASGPK